MSEEVRGQEVGKSESPEDGKKSEVGGQKSEEENDSLASSQAGAIDIPNSEIRPATYNTQPATNTMEVHHHPDLHHEKKPWKEYFLEFLMIFLAVTMGFFAETI